MLYMIALLIGSAASAAAVTEIPFEFYRNQILLKVQVDGQGPFTMLLDTGTDPSAVDLQTARRIGLKIKSGGHRVAGGGTEPNLGYMTELPSVQIGDEVARNVAAVAIDLSKLSAELGVAADGVLGHSFLSGRTVQIDYMNRLVRFYDAPLLSNADSQAVEPGRVLFRFRYRNNILIDDVFVNGRKVAASIDTGANEAFQLTPAVVRMLGIEDEASKGQPVPSVGYNGRSVNTRGVVGSIKIGPIVLDSPAVMFFSKQAGHDSEAWGLNIGNPFLRDFVVTIDYRTHMLSLQR